MAGALRAVEFYSGIGGMHYALQSSAVAVNVVAAIDINTTANEVYAHNFPDTVLMNRNIEGIKLAEFTKFNADIFTMSPPCQPFTRQGNQKASDDPRTKSFLYIMKIIKSLTKPPSYILMENVKGFEVSETRAEFVRTLRETHYCFQEFLLSPSQFGIPNSRLRYFLIAVHKPLQLPFPATDSIMNNIPAALNSKCKPFTSFSTDNPRSHCPVCNKQSLEPSNKTTNNIEDDLLAVQRESLINKAESTEFPERNCSLNLEKICNKKECKEVNDRSDECTMNSASKTNVMNTERDPKTDLHDEECDKTCDQIRNGDKNIQDYLEEGIDHFEQFLVPENILKKKVLLMDIVQIKCNHSCCFTKGYAHYVEGTGSVLQMSTVDSSSIFEKYSEANEDEKIKLLTPLGLRYFTPREIANILCFPKNFDFPATVSRKQKYRLLGNSLNVLVVTELMKILFKSDSKEQLL